MGVFDKVFKITDPAVLDKINSSAVEYTLTEDSMNAVRADMLKDGLSIDGLVFNAGALAFVSRTASVKDENGQPRAEPIEIKDAITRLENVESFEHPIVLRAAYKMKSTQKDTFDFPVDYLAYIVPSVPDVEGVPKPDKFDVIRTIQVLKTDDAAPYLWDQAPDNFTFIKGDDGKLISYPATENTPEEFRGKPIAFIRDLNAVPADLSGGRAKDPELSKDQVADAIKEGKENRKEALKIWIKNVYSESRVVKLTEFIASDSLTADQKKTAFEAINSVLELKDEDKIVPEKLADSRSDIISGISRKFDNAPDKIVAFMDAVKGKLEESHPLKSYNSLKSEFGNKENPEYRLDYDTLLAAPRECVEACKQQYALTAKLAENLKRHGIEPNMAIPEPPASKTEVLSTEIGATVEAKVSRG